MNKTLRTIKKNTLLYLRALYNRFIKAKIFIFLLGLIVTVFIAIAYICYLDSTTNESQTIESKVNYKFENTFSDKKLELQINYLTQRKISSTTWTIQKETNAWAAFALYLTGVVVLFNFLHKIRFNYFVTFIIIIFIIVSAATSTFAFIHSQYSSIYLTSADANASNELISRIIDKGKPVSNMSECISQLSKNNLIKNQKFREKKHPLKILKYLLRFDWTKSSNDRELRNNLNIQEATIYFLMILFNIILIIYVIKQYYVISLLNNKNT